MLMFTTQVQDTITHLQAMLPDATKADNHNKAAGTRLRNDALDVIKQLQALRKSSLEADKALDQSRAGAISANAVAK